MKLDVFQNKQYINEYDVRMSFTIRNIAVHTLEFWRFRNKYNSPTAVKIFVTFLRIVTIAMFMYFKLKGQIHQKVLWVDRSRTICIIYYQIEQ